MEVVICVFSQAFLNVKRGEITITNVLELAHHTVTVSPHVVSPLPAAVPAGGHLEEMLKRKRKKTEP